MNEILTERIKLRLIEISDLDSIHQLHSLPETDEFNALGIPKNIDEGLFRNDVLGFWIVPPLDLLNILYCSRHL